MNDSNKPDRLHLVDLLIEGNEDLSVRRWTGPSPHEGRPIVVGAEERCTAEPIPVLIAGDEDLTVRPWGRSTAARNAAEEASSLPWPDAEGTVPGEGVPQSIHVETIGGVTVVSFSGGVGAEGLLEAADRLDRLIDDPAHRRLLLNLSHVPFLASAALARLIKLRKKAHTHRGELRLCCVHPDLMEVFRISRVDRVFRIYDDEPSARAAWGQE
jgi:anti-sigma B factor antagonist